MTTHAQYGEMLLQFAKSADIVDEATFKTLIELIESYVHKTLDIKSVVVMIDVVSDGDADEENSKELKKMFTQKASCTIRVGNDGDYRGQTYFSYDKGKPLWIVAKNNGLLSEADEFIDLWSGEKKIPRYLSGDVSEAKTSIIVPIKKGGHTYGVVNYESKNSLELTIEAKRELVLINDAISRLFKSSRFSSMRTEDTAQALNNLRSWLDGNNIVPLKKPKIFLATPDNVKDDVIEIIRDELRKRETIVEEVYWRELNKTGDIQGQIFKAIASCRFAICYLSEPTTEADPAHMFTDNSNVIFEAGMFHSKTNIATSENSIWIPVREDLSPKPPMDFSSQRMIIVKRNNDGELEDEFELRQMFSARIDALLNM